MRSDEKKNKPVRESAVVLGGSVRPRVELNANMLTGNTLMCIRYNFSLVYRVNVIKSCQLALNTD